MPSLGSQSFLVSPAFFKLCPWQDVSLMPEGGFFVGSLNAQGQPHGREGQSFHNNGGTQVQLLKHDSGDQSKDGHWINGGLYGQALQRFADGDWFEGEFQDGLFSGLGCFTWRDDAHCEGEFSNGERNGFGIEWCNKRHIIQSGRWERDQLVKWCAVPVRCIRVGRYLSEAARQALARFQEGFLLQLTVDGSFFIGELNAEEQPHGSGIRFHLDGSVEVSMLPDASNPGRWVNGTVHGRAIKTLDNGDRLEGFFEQDRLLSMLSAESKASAIKPTLTISVPVGKSSEKSEASDEQQQTVC